MKFRQQGFTLVEIAIALLIVTILLGYTVALFPQQQRLKQYRAVNQHMDQIIEAVIGFAQVNGRLPCPALVNSNGIEDFDNETVTDSARGCNTYGGFVPINTLGLDGTLNDDELLVDPWGNPYRYYVTNSNANGNNASGGPDSDFVYPGEMRAVGLVDMEDLDGDGNPDGDGYIDLDGQYMICDAAGSSDDNQCTGANTVFGRYSGSPTVRYAGAPFVLLSMGKNWSQTPVGDELENAGTTTVTSGGGAPSYRIKDVAGGKTTFVRRADGFADDFDDVVRWVSPNVLFARMIKADQLP